MAKVRAGQFSHARDQLELARLTTDDRDLVARIDLSLAYVDAETKQLRPAFPEELAAEAKAASAAVAAEGAAPPVIKTTESGATGVMLDDSYMSYAVAHKEPDGSIKQDCVENQPSEAAALKTAVTAPGVDNHEK